MNLEINEYKLICTCEACPEQYDVLDKNSLKAGYLRLRHGHFRADCPTVGGTTVYESDTIGDGVFDETERIVQLTKAVEAIKGYWEDLKSTYSEVE